MTTMDAMTAPIAMVPVPTPAAAVVPAAAPAFTAPASAPVWLNAMDGMNATEKNQNGYDTHVLLGSKSYFQQGFFILMCCCC
jgi:hypothetical protein